MQIFTKKILFSLLIVFISITIFFSGIIDKKENYFAQASLWDLIRAWVTINPLEVNVSAPAEVEVDRVFEVTAKVINKGEEKIENAKSEIFLPEGLNLLKKNPVQKIGIIPPKKEKYIHWSAKGEKVGNYVISVKVSGTLEEKEVSVEDSTLVKVIEKSFRGRKNPFDFFQRFFDFLQKWPGL